MKKLVKCDFGGQESCSNTVCPHYKAHEPNYDCDKNLCCIKETVTECLLVDTPESVAIEALTKIKEVCRSSDDMWLVAENALNKIKELQIQE